VTLYVLSTLTHDALFQLIVILIPLFELGRNTTGISVFAPTKYVSSKEKKRKKEKKEKKKEKKKKK
jgi:hypothetical protein